MILDEDLADFDKGGKLCYVPVVQNPDENWTQARGRITKSLVENFMPFEYGEGNDSLIMVCGP
jgi:NAD(P)H-flavin reductase